MAAPRTYALVVPLLLVLGGCSAGGDDPTTDATAADDDGCITDFDAGTDYFPDKSQVLDAENFSLEYENSYQVLTVDEPYPGGEPESYVLVHCGAPEPELTGELADAPRITVPIDSLYSASTTHLPLLTELGELDVLAAVSEGTFVSDAEVLERIESGAVAEYAPGQTVNSELVLTEAPDVLMTAGVDDPAYAALRDAGIGVVANAEWLESSALGRAEWIKVMGALTGSEVKAGEAYDAIRTAYTDVAELAADATDVEVLPGTMFSGTWYMPAGGSYVGRLLDDAGATYPWAGETGSGSLELSFESVFAEGGQAPIWLVTSQWDTVADALAEDARYAELAAAGPDGQVWSATAAIGPGGGNDFYERGVVRPDLVLADLVAILHPELLPDHEFTFYRPVAAA